MGNCTSNQSGGGSGRKSHKLQNYDPVRYHPDPGRIRDPTRIVNRVHFVAQTVLQNGGNHWGIYLQTGPAAAVSINMDPGDVLGAAIPGHGYRGRMDITHRNYAVTRNQERIITIPATRGHPVTHFIDAIINAGNHEYDFTTEGRGCTGWILDQFHLFLRLGLIPRGFDVMETAINLEWYSGKPRSSRQATRGFYMRDTRGGGWGSGGAGRRAGKDAGRKGRR